jgi:hypothetical protein
VVWVKTEAGKQEMQTRSVLTGRAQRNLLLLIDGKKSEDQLLTSISGIGPADFEALRLAGLIAFDATGYAQPAAMPVRNAAPPIASPAPVAAAPAQPLEAVPVSYAHLTETLTGLISSELGLRGFKLTLAVERASNVDELRGVADRVIEQIRDRRGVATAEKARRALFGG